MKMFQRCIRPLGSSSRKPVITSPRNTFMLAKERTLVEFVKKVSEICRGKAYFTTTMTLGQFILMDFMKRRTRKVS